jgi:starch-binding outer membrane protein, SusD/RagB family
MKKTKYILLLTLALVWGCDDKLDVKPLNTISSAQALSTSGDVEALIVGAYSFLGDGDVYGGNILRDAELLGDDGEIAWDGTFVAPGEIWAKTILITNDQVQTTWLDAYRVINICNTVLANINLVTPDKKSRVEGEAKFIRGTLYFELARFYGKTWVDGNPIQNLAVPLILDASNGTNATAKVTRATVGAVYAQVISDLQSAETLLPTRNGFFATTYSASAILSRVYLMQNNFPAAAASADKVIGSGAFSLTSAFADAFNRTSTASTSRSSNTNATTEDVFAMQVTSQAGVNNMWTFFDPAGRSDIPIEAAHFALYELGDARADFFDGDFTLKFSNTFGNVPIVRLAELYLTRAEANFRAGTSVGASPLADINRIRNRATLPSVGSVTLASILAERRVELAFEGHLIHDFKRTQRPVGVLPFNSPKLVYPIPQRERILNADLVQNEGYQ